MSLFSGTKLTDRDIDSQTQQRVRLIIKRLMNGEFDPPDAIRQLTDLIVRASNARTRTPQGREQGESDAENQRNA